MAELKNVDRFTGSPLVTFTALPVDLLRTFAPHLRPRLAERHLNWLSALLHWRATCSKQSEYTELCLAVTQLLKVDVPSPTDGVRAALSAGPAWYKYTVVATAFGEDKDHCVLCLPGVDGGTTFGVISQVRIPHVMAMYSGSTDFRVSLVPGRVVWSQMEGEVNATACMITGLVGLLGTVIIVDRGWLDSRPSGQPQ